MQVLTDVSYNERGGQDFVGQVRRCCFALLHSSDHLCVLAKYQRTTSNSLQHPCYSSIYIGTPTTTTKPFARVNLVKPPTRYLTPIAGKMSDSDVYTAERILSKRKRHGVTQYLIKWKGYSLKKSTWEPEENIIDRNLITAFESKKASTLPTKATPKSNRARLIVLNPQGSQAEQAVLEDIVFEPVLTKEPILVTDVTSKDYTVTISECKTPEGFFRSDLDLTTTTNKERIN